MLLNVVKIRGYFSTSQKLWALKSVGTVARALIVTPLIQALVCYVLSWLFCYISINPVQNDPLSEDLLLLCPSSMRSTFVRAVPVPLNIPNINEQVHKVVSNATNQFPSGIHDWQQAIKIVVFTISQWAMTQQTAIAKGTFHVYRPIASLLITGGHFPQILDLFQVFKISVLSGSLRKTSIFKITMADDVTLWSKLESTW